MIWDYFEWLQYRNLKTIAPLVPATAITEETNALKLLQVFYIPEYYSP